MFVIGVFALQNTDYNDYTTENDYHKIHDKVSETYQIRHNVGN